MLKPGTHMESGLMYRVCGKQGEWPITHGVKFLDRLYVAILPCPTVMLSGKHEFKVFQHNGYFSSDSAAAGLLSDHLTALVFFSSALKYMLELCYQMAALLDGCDKGLCLMPSSDLFEMFCLQTTRCSRIFTLLVGGSS